MLLFEHWHLDCNSLSSMQVIQTKFTFPKFNSRRIFDEFIRFSMIKPRRRTCRPCPDRGRHLVCPWLHRPLFPPPSATASCGYKGSAPPMSSRFSTFVFCSHPASAPPHVVPTPTAAPRSTEHRLLRPPPYPTVASSSSTPCQCTSVSFPAPAPTTSPAPHWRSSPLNVRCHR
jgi:hypothetical protein